MKQIKTKAQFEKAREEVFNLMNKGERNLTKKEKAQIIMTGKAIQHYEETLYPIIAPKTLTGMIELKMYEKKINQIKLAEKLGISASKLNMILNGKQKPDVEFLKNVRKELKISADFILDHV